MHNPHKGIGFGLGWKTERPEPTIHPVKLKHTIPEFGGSRARQAVANALEKAASGTRLQ